MWKNKILNINKNGENSCLCKVNEDKFFIGAVNGNVKLFDICKNKIIHTLKMSKEVSAIQINSILKLKNNSNFFLNCQGNLKLIDLEKYNESNFMIYEQAVS